MGTYDTTIGTLVVGIFLNTFLYGLVTHKYAVYYCTKFDDRPAIKYMVGFLFVLDTFHSASAVYMAWYYTVTNYDNPAALAGKESWFLSYPDLTTLKEGIWPYVFTPVTTALAALVTQFYLGSRIWRFTYNKYLYGVAVLLAIPSFVLGTTCSIKAYIIKFASELTRITPFVVAWLSMQVAVDTYLTTTLVVVFYRSRTGIRTTDTILSQLILGAIQTGLFVTIFALGDLITFVALPHTDLYGMFSIPLGRIYTNTLMDTLITRKSLMEKLQAADRVGVGYLTSKSPFDWSRANAAIQSSGIHPAEHGQWPVQETYDESSCAGGEGHSKQSPISV